MKAIIRSIGRIVAIMLALGWSARPVLAEVVAVVSAKSAVAALNRNQLVDIFLCKTSRLPNGEIAMPIDLPEGSSLRNEFYSAFAGKSPAQVKAHWSKLIFTGRGQPPREAADMESVKRLLLANPSAIGYLDRSMVGGELRILTIAP